MIKKALEYIIGLQKEPFIKEIEGQKYTDTELRRISHIPYAERIEMHTLSSLVEYIKGNIDKMAEKMIIEVESPTKVKLYSQLDVERNREYLVKVNARVPRFSFNQFMDSESFVIAMQAKFLENEDRNYVQQFAGTVEAGTVASYGDDGVTQQATVKTGIANKETALVPNPVTLCPYRTFIEVEQPQSQFVFRMKQDKYDGIQCALFEADGGAWQLTATENIHKYLKNELEELAGFTIIS